MSQYIHFYVRRRDEFINLCEFSRNSYVYIALQDLVVYEKIQPLTENDLGQAKDFLKERISTCKERIKRLQEINRQIAQMTDSIDEKTHKIYQNMDEIKEYEGDIVELTDALGCLSFLFAIYWDNDDWMWDTEKERKVPFLYVGIESSYNPSVNDIA